jgi:hypothetical protein
LAKDVNRELLVDKLSERWLTERAVTTLYELAIERLPQDSDVLTRFLEQERLHVEMLEQLLIELGREPRSAPSTPSTNLAASEMEALVELARDRHLMPRHLLEVLLAAELLDGSGWDLLVELGREARLDDEWLRSFRVANREEQEHEHVIRGRLLGYERAELAANIV